MTKTLTQLRQGLSEKIGDWWSGTVDAGEKNYLKDQALADKRESPHSGQWVLFVSGTTGDADDGEIRIIDRFSSEDNKWEINWLRPLSADLVANVVYELHRYHPDDLTRALNAARIAAFPWLYKVIDDQTIITRDIVRRYTLPTSLIGAPDEVRIDSWADPDISENLLDNGDFDDWTGSQPDDWNTPTHLTLAEEDDGFLEGEIICKATTDGTADQLSQTVSSATTYAGQRLTIVIAVYSETADKLKAFIYDGTTTTKSTDFHAGGGWEELTISANMIAAPSELTAGVDVAATGTHTFYVRHASLTASRERPRGEGDLELNWKYLGTTQIEFGRTLPNNRPLRIKGKGLLSSVSADADEMEISDPQTELLYAEAASYLFRQMQTRRPTDADEYATQLAYWQSEVRRLRIQVAMPLKAQFRISPTWGQ